MSLAASDTVEETTARALGHLAAGGTWLRSEERLEAASKARDALGGVAADGSLTDEVIQAVATAPEFVSQDWVADLEARGMNRLEYVELVGIVTKMAALDGLARGLGADPYPLPDPVPVEPSRRANVEAELTTAFVPIAGRPGATSALNSVVRESEAQEDLSTGYYMGYQQMDEPDQVVRGLHRTQIELVAARTSYLNDCYY